MMLPVPQPRCGANGRREPEGGAREEEKARSVDGAAFDVFLSYSRADQAVIERIAQHLHAHGLTVFLDRWYLAPGRSWPEALESALAQSRAVAVLLGPNG